MKIYKQCLVFSVIFIMQFTISAQVNNAYDVIKKMKSNYEGKWYTHLTFEQNTLFYKNDSLQKQETWYEAMALGKGLTIKFGSKSSGDGYVFKNDSMSVYKENKLINKGKRVHDLLVLGFDVYFNEATETIKKLEASGMDFSHFKETNEHYIIGNPETKQVWIEKKRLLFTKIIASGRNGAKSRTEFNKYHKLGEGWIAPEVLFYANNKLLMKEEYLNIKTPEKISDKVFAFKNFKSVTW